MHRFIIASCFLLISSIIYAQDKDFTKILSLAPDSIDRVELVSDETTVCLKMNFEQDHFLNPEVYNAFRGQAIAAIHLVYTAYHHPKFDQRNLNLKRLKALYQLDSTIFQQFGVQWKIIAQSNCHSKTEGAAMFHGFIIRFHPTPTPESMEAEIAYLESIFGSSTFFESPLTKETILRKADQMPSFSGGEVAQRRYFDRNLRYPESANEKRKAGTVLISIIIDENGKVTEPKLMRGFDAECDQEALRLVQEMPDWNPGIEGEDFVKVKIHFPVTFKIPGASQKSDYIYYDEYWREQNLETRDSINNTNTALGKSQKSIETELFIQIFQRNPDWQQMTLVCDLTGSMSPYTAQLLTWFREDLSTDTPRIKTFTFFNDGDKLSNADKVIGKTGGIYNIGAQDFESVKAQVYQTMRRGSGGDLPENNLEAALAAVENCAECPLVMVADNYTTPRDLSLSELLHRPLKIILCGTQAGINPWYLKLAHDVGGSVHTKEQDIYNISEIYEGEKVIIGKQCFQFINGCFVCIN